MSDDTPGAGQGALPPREGQSLRPAAVAERPTTMRLTQVAGGQYVLTTQQHGVPALAQLSPASLSNVQGGVTRIISISPSRGQTSPLRPSLTNQSIVNVLKRGNPNVRLQLFQQSSDGGAGSTASTSSSPSAPTTPTHSRPLKRPSSSTPEKKDSYAAKLQRVSNHRMVRSKLVKEKYAEHLLELFYLESGGNILDLYQFAKRPKSQAYLAYMREHAIDPKEYADEPAPMTIPHTTPSTPSATSASSLPGISVNNISQSPSIQQQQQQQPSSAHISEVTVPTAPTPELLPAVKSATSSTASNSQEQIVEKAKQEAYVVQRIGDLQKEGLWSEKRLPKVQEMSRGKAHWDFLLEEMVWLAADFAQERKWKKAAAKKCARMVQKYFQDKALAAQRAEKAQEQHLKRIAAFCAKEIKIFWGNVEKLVEYKQNTILEEKRKKALDQQLSFIVDQTEKYSQLLAEGMNKSAADVPSSNISSRSASRPQSDDEFDPEMQSDEDDEETIAQEEAALGNADQSAEVEALQRESQLELDDLLEDDFLRNYLLNRDNIRLSGSEDSDDESEDKKSKKSEPEPVSTKKPAKEKIVIEKESKSDSNDSDDDLDSEEESDVDDMQSSQTENQSLKLLMDDSQKNDEGEKTKTDEKDDLINDAAAIAESIQPKGNTLSSTTVSTKVPFLLKLPLREYQHIGLDWLVTMYERKLNGILADEMGLGKTIQTIALLAHLACEKENWGPHLIVVPTSVMLNWEMECKKWCPAFKILTYYGSQKERKQKRTGWTKPNTFHICITSYKLVIQDHQSFRRKKWKYLILDEAQNIKNFKSQRWQLLLNFQTERRLLLTGTPLQNNLMELWSLMHFLMPNVFQSHREFKEWFSNPVTGMIEGNSEYNDSIIKRLHKVLRPFLLRRLKSEVEKQMPKKYEHVVMCRLSKRQRFLYDDYMSRAKTRETLASGNLLSVINVLMQLRKVCNHPNLFEVRPTISPFQCDSIKMHIPSIVYSALQYDVFKHVNLYSMNLLLVMLEMHLGAYQCYRMRYSAKKVIALDQPSGDKSPPCPPCKLSMKVKIRDIKQEDRKEVRVHHLARNATIAAQSNVKMKVAGVQVVSQGVVKTVPLINISQAGGPVQLGTPINVSSVLKPTDKVPTSFAQLVQTSTGKHLLLTSNPNITGNVPVSQTTAGGQKLTFLSTKQPITTNANATQPITKAYVKFQLTSVTTGMTTTSSNSTAAVRGGEDGLRPVNSNFLGQLYSKQNSLDVRWRRDDNRRSSNQPQDDPKNEYKRRLQLMTRINEQRCSAMPLYGRDFQDVVKIYEPNAINPWNGGHINCLNALFDKNLDQTTGFLKNVLYSPERRIEELKEVCDRFIFYVPAVKTDEPEIRVWHPPPSEYWARKEEQRLIQHLFSKPATPLHHIASAMVTQFPDPRLIQYDCGKLQTLDKLLRQLKCGSHRVLIFTQMTKMLDVLEAFLNFHGHIYLRLDGSTKVDQRQVLMERFNGDKRIFAFILSTRSGGVGVNLTGADTVVFYDSDWNPTMDAQAQDRCHRIGQTRDVHIYRLVSERTIEENILKKANQKRLLGDLAIEGGNFTTAYFKSSTIQDLFNIDQTLETAAQRMSEIVENRREVPAIAEAASTQPEDKSAAGALETALAACEDDQDVQAAKIAKAEAVADLAEFDENIPLEQETEKEREPEVSKAEQEINNIIEKLSPIEKYAMKFIEQTESAWSAEQLAAAARQIEEQKREWELNQMAAMREEEERRQRELDEENDMITYTREDATNQVWVSENTKEQMPMWCPPTPPQQDTDVYMDQTMSFLYDNHVMSESQLPPIYVKKDPKRRFETTFGMDYRRPLKIPRKEDGASSAPRSLFHSPTLLKMRRDLKLQKYRGLMRPSLSVPGKPTTGKPSSEQSLFHNWTIHEDVALLKVIRTFQGLPLNLIVMSPGQTPNWDFVAEYVNTVSITYRSPKQCRQRYEGHLMHREEGKYSSLESAIRKKKKQAQLQKLPLPNKSRPSPRTSQLYTQDNNATFSQILIERFDSFKAITNKRQPTTRTVVNNPLMNKTKNTPLLSDCGIDLEHPVLPVEVAARKAERIAKEKKTVTPEQMAKLQLMKGLVANQQLQQQQAQAQASLSSASTSGTAVVQSTSGVPTMVVPTTQVMTSQAPIVVTTSTPAANTTPGTPPSGLRPQRIIASPLQTSTVVSVSGLSPAQLQAATQRLIVSAGGATKAVSPGPGQGKQFSQAQLQMIRQASLKNQLRLHANSLAQGTKTSTVTIGGQQAVVQFTQAQPRAQFVRQGTVTVGGKTGVTRTVTDSEVAQLLKKQHQLQQQKLASGNVAQASSAAGGSGNTIHGLTTQVFAQAIQQAGTSGQVTTLVKAVPSSSGATQTVTIPVSGVTLASPGTKAIAPSLKPTTQQQLRQMQIQQQLLAQKKLAAAAAASGQKLSIATVVGGKQAMTVQQFQQVIRTPLSVAQGPVVLAKGGSRVIPVNAQGTKQTIQVVAATSQALGSALRPQGATTIAGIKLQGATNTSQQQALLSQVSAALNQNVTVRQNSPVRLQTASGQPIVAVTVQSPSQNAQPQSPNPEQQE